MIHLEGLVKTFGRFTAVDDVSLDVPEGEIHGFLGPNGAGKTTTIRMIAGLLQPTRGRVSIDGHDLGTAWTFPFRVKVPADLLGKGLHELEVRVTNVWNNRLVGDQFLPEEERITRTNMQGRHTKDSPLVASGLLGPVTLQRVEEG